ncbi:MAG: 2-C-methyl-D-erythritol 2,4-cyclodiphosphate synthase [Brockia lithotrophica]|uniref:2-C-methyl-D-erythritol 2,4-cyclodiphosphate synthase n=1 Tax=Brockia lithotrophica TaxID=933949 RepID=A0A2T5G507_9BACL|nr:2-C-methyl-D-erythritol 2,4-cyclodiphosphate synthase [Brockia lithotrophica]PTQ51272.1 MAG: 2-C-methyl-D-erythritol 2,4-cyclodiphosphate synthase [Brockia lithotrophica]
MFRVGIGYDVHRFAVTRPLVLGGISIPYDRGLEGHSDADVLLHALADALLGALALGDIGEHFPNTDPRFRDLDSTEIVRHAYGLVRARGYHVGNVDAVVVAEEPKLSPYIPEMRKRIAEILDTSLNRVSVKATTPERLGALGKKEGIAAWVVVLLLSPTDSAAHDKGGPR